MVDGSTTKRRRVDDRLLPDGGKQLESALFFDIKNDNESDDVPGDSEDDFLETKQRDVKLEDEDDSTSEGSQVDESENDVAAAWHDSDDDAAYIDIRRFPKFRKLQKFGQPCPTTDQISAADFHQRLKKFRESRSQSGRWAKSLRHRAEEHDRQQADNTDRINVDDFDDINASAAKGSGAIATFLRSSAAIMATTASGLPVATLHYVALRDANCQERSQCPIKCAQFVPTTNLLYTGGRDKTMRFYEGVGGVNPRKVSGVHFERSPIKSTSAFCRAGGAPLVLGLCGRQSFFEVDVTTSYVLYRESTHRYPNLHRLATASAAGLFSVLADDGHILLGDARMKAIAHDFKMNAYGRCLEMLNSSSVQETRLLTGDNEGKVYEWDLIAGKCVHVFQDEGSTCVTSLALSPSANYLAVGSRSGYVNIYDVRRSRKAAMPACAQPDAAPTSFSIFDQLSKLPADNRVSEYDYTLAKETKPLKSLGHLTAAATTLKFHPSNELLAIGSSFTREGLKLVGVRVCAFKNFPRQDESLHLLYPTVVDFSPSGHLMIVGNSHGAVKTFFLPHFSTKGPRHKAPERQKRHFI